MPLYFMVHDAERFGALIRPALAASWQRRSSEPLQSLQFALREDFERFVTENRIRREELILLGLQPQAPFNRDIWRTVAGEVLLAAAADVPEIPDVEETLVRILGEDPSIRQAYHGSRGLCFGGAWYRPDHAGYNAPDDVLRLANWLTCIDHARFQDKLPGPNQTDEDEKQEEWAFTCQAFNQLATVYDRARTGGQLIVCEVID
jgi:hypothetical protein